MSQILSLIQSLAEQEQSLTHQPFMAPCILKGKIRVKLSGLLCTLKPQPANYEGWGIFEATDTHTAVYQKPVKRTKVDAYLNLFPSLRVRLAFHLQGRTWLAYPQYEGDMRQRFGHVKPIVVHLVKGCSRFEPIVVRWDGSSFWWQKSDRSSSIVHTKKLRQALRQEILSTDLSFSGLTPEMKVVYRLVCKSLPAFSPKHQAEKRLKNALDVGGGALENFTDRGDYWTVQWMTSDGVAHSSAIAKKDLTVIGAGICLSGRDEDFDLQSLVGVVEQQWY